VRVINFNCNPWPLACSLAHPRTQKSIKSAAQGSVFIFYNNDNFSFSSPAAAASLPLRLCTGWMPCAKFSRGESDFLDPEICCSRTTRRRIILRPSGLNQASGWWRRTIFFEADAAAVGENEFALGIEKFQALAKKANFPFISSNIYKKGTNDLFLKDSVMLEASGQKNRCSLWFYPGLKLPQN